MDVRRIGSGSGFYIDVSLISEDEQLRARLTSALEAIGVSYGIPVSKMNAAGGSSTQTANILNVVLIDQPSLRVSSVREAIMAMIGSRGLILIHAKSGAEVTALFDGCKHGCFVSDDLFLLLQPIRQLTAGTGLIGIDLADFFGIWAGKVTWPRRANPDDLISLMLHALPFDAALISFPRSMPLAQIDILIDRLRLVLPRECDLVWHDPPALSDGFCEFGIANGHSD